MNALWTIIMIAGIIAMLLVNPDGAINSMISGANNAVTLALTLLASYALWLGLFKLVDKTGISGVLTKLLRRPVNFLFPGVNDKAKGYLSANIAANFLGLGNRRHDYAAGTVEYVASTAAFHRNRSSRGKGIPLPRLVSARLYMRHRFIHYRGHNRRKTYFFYRKKLCFT